MIELLSSSANQNVRAATRPSALGMLDPGWNWTDQEIKREIDEKFSKCDKLLIYSSDVQNSSELH